MFSDQAWSEAPKELLKNRLQGSVQDVLSPDMGGWEAAGQPRKIGHEADFEAIE